VAGEDRPRQPHRHAREQWRHELGVVAEQAHASRQHEPGQSQAPDGGGQAPAGSDPPGHDRTAVPDHRRHRQRHTGRGRRRKAGVDPQPVHGEGGGRGGRTLGEIEVSGGAVHDDQSDRRQPVHGSDRQPGDEKGQEIGQRLYPRPGTQVEDAAA
jgi:hypothetical protein